jgi:predicted ATP-grasp superfamily ATP-dependent carboligase
VSRTALVVEDGRTLFVLSAVRSLARAGWRVAVASPEPDRRVMSSRRTSSWHPVPLPEDDLGAFVDGVARAVRRSGAELVFGADDIELLALSQAREALPARVPHAPHEAVLRSVDKLTLTEAARAVGVAVPATRAAGAAALADLDGPVVVKPRLHWQPGHGGPRHLPAGRCATPDEARALVARIEALGGAAVLQEPVDGEQIALSVVLDDDGRLRAVAQQRTVRASLQRTSSRAETTAVDAGLLDGVQRLLRGLGWTGLANLQFLRDDAGVPRLIDLNGRFYGSLALAVAAGADLPAVWAAAATGAPAGPVVTARPGVRFQSLHPDLLRARAERRGGLRADVVDTLRYAVGAAHTTWAVDDPLPALRHAGAVVAGGLARRTARG